MGTHAHEVMSIFGQLLAAHDDAAGDAEHGPVQVQPLLPELHGPQSATRTSASDLTSSPLQDA